MLFILSEWAMRDEPVALNKITIAPNFGFYDTFAIKYSVRKLRPKIRHGRSNVREEKQSPSVGLRNSDVRSEKMDVFA